MALLTKTTIKTKVASADMQMIDANQRYMARVKRL